MSVNVCGCMDLSLCVRMFVFLRLCMYMSLCMYVHERVYVCVSLSEYLHVSVCCTASVMVACEETSCECECVCVQLQVYTVYGCL